MALNELKLAYNTDVSPILEMYRSRSGGAIDPISTYRTSDYRKKIESKRPVSNSPSSSGIV
jgi:L-rhamnose isomerase/sugar isomerase